jgi:hypothetical protein
MSLFIKKVKRTPVYADLPTGQLLIYVRKRPASIIMNNCFLKADKKLKNYNPKHSRFQLTYISTAWQPNKF